MEQKSEKAIKMIRNSLEGWLDYEDVNYIINVIEDLNLKLEDFEKYCDYLRNENFKIGFHVISLMRDNSEPLKELTFNLPPRYRNKE